MTRRRAGIAAALAAAVGAGLAGSAAADLTLKWEHCDQLVAGRALAVAVDPDGNAYVGGTYRQGGSTGASASWVRRYSPYGFMDWSITRVGTSTSYEDGVRGVALFPVSATAWDVIVAGVSWNGTDQDAWAARLTALGATVWVATLDSGPGSYGVNGVAVSPAGEIVVTGWAPGTGGVADIWVGRYSASGALLSDAAYTDLLGNEDEGRAVAVDASGSIYVAGYMARPGEVTNAWLGKYPAAGPLGSGPLWTLTLDGDDSSTDYLRGVAVDSSAGAVYAVGAVTGLTGWRDVLAMRAGLDGALVWTLTLDGGETDNDEAGACAVASGGDLLVAGALDTPAPNFMDAWLARFSADGALACDTTRDGLAHYVDAANGVAADASGRFWIVGEQADTTGVPHPYIAVFVESGGSGPNTASARPFASPNPFRPGSGGAFDAPGVAFRSIAPGSALRIYTIAGELVVELLDDDRDGLITWDARNASGKEAASGVYIFVVDTEGGAASRGKVVIIR